MIVLGRNKLTKFARKHTNSKDALDVWYHEVTEAEWLTSHDVRAQFQVADFISNNRVIFNIKGNHYRLIVKVKYSESFVAVEWIGKHDDYSKLKL